MKRQPLSPEAKAAATARLNDIMRTFCEDVEQRRVLIGVLAALEQQPREA